MRALSFYFQVHQPYRVRPFPFVEIGQAERVDWYDTWLNDDVARRVARLCYLPMNETLRRAIDSSNGEFRCAFSISGTALRQFAESAPEVLESFRDLHATGCVEFLCETSRHSLAALIEPDEFRAQVDEQRELLATHLGVDDSVTFRNTELIVDGRVARLAEECGFKTLMGEGADGLLAQFGEAAHPGTLFRPGAASDLDLFLRDYELSDDIAFRFSNQGWDRFPLFAPDFVASVHKLGPERRAIGLFMDYETFGEHQPKSTGIFEFMAAAIDQVVRDPELAFVLPREIGRFEGMERRTITYERPYSWADEERDLSAWLGNHMQRSATEAIYALRPAVLAAGDADLLEAWRDLTTSDHVYYQSTKFASDGDVHEYFSPYGTPHDAFVYVMNAIEDLAQRVERHASTP